MGLQKFLAFFVRPLDFNQVVRTPRVNSPNIKKISRYVKKASFEKLALTQTIKYGIGIANPKIRTSGCQPL
jgi:hypothetical protein